MTAAAWLVEANDGSYRTDGTADQVRNEGLRNESLFVLTCYRTYDSVVFLTGCGCWYWPRR